MLVIAYVMMAWARTRGRLYLSFPGNDGRESLKSDAEAVCQVQLCCIWGADFLDLAYATQVVDA